MDKKYIEIKRKADCTGCRACEQLCPKKCIKMIEDDEGFIYPVVNTDECINCGICKNRCPQFNSKIFKNKNKSIIYGIKPKNEVISKGSTSGGMAYIISKEIINEGGVVFGCAYDEDMNVEHVCVKECNDLEKIRGSKYVFSDTKNSYIEIKKFLESDKKVFFVGCPCQVAGLKSFLNKNYENLLTADIICHGVPSDKLFKKYLSWKEEKIGERINNYIFRSKEKVGWGMGYCALIQTNNRKIFQNADFDGYYTAFLSGKVCRESCYECKYADINRVGDITLGDFWGIEKFDKKMYSKNGISLVFVNTEKGNEILNKVDDDIIYKKYSENEAVMYNGNLVNPTMRPEIRNIIYKKLDTMKFEIYLNKYILTNKHKIKSVIKNLIPKNLKLLYKKYLR